MIAVFLGIFTFRRFCQHLIVLLISYVPTFGSKNSISLLCFQLIRKYISTITVQLLNHVTTMLSMKCTNKKMSKNVFIRIKRNTHLEIKLISLLYRRTYSILYCKVQNNNGLLESKRLCCCSQYFWGFVFGSGFCDIVVCVPCS